MNRLLIGILDLLNKLVAIMVIIVFTAGGYLGNIRDYLPVHPPPGVSGQVLSTLIGFVAGLVAAALVCGILATFITIARELIAIRENLEAGRG
jgi:hypothetical protein